MTEEEKNQKMIRDYQLSAKGLKRDILRLKLELAKTTRPDDRYQLARRIEALECRSEERRVWKECRSRWSPYH